MCKKPDHKKEIDVEVILTGPKFKLGQDLLLVSRDPIFREDSGSSVKTGHIVTVIDESPPGMPGAISIEDGSPDRKYRMHYWTKKDLAKDFVLYNKRNW